MAPVFLGLLARFPEHFLDRFAPCDEMASARRVDHCAFQNF